MKPKLSFVVIALLFLYVPKQLNAQVNVQDSLALVDLYNSTNGPHWINRTNWLTSKPVSKWYGVEVQQKRVYNLGLGINNLNGSIPASIGNLTGMVYFDLNDNKLTGKIPKEMGNLKS